VYQLKGVGMITPLGYLLTIWLTSSVRDRPSGSKRGTAPLTQRQVESILVSILLGFVFPSVMVILTLNPYWIAFWQPLPVVDERYQTLYLLAVPAPPSSSSVQQARVRIGSLQVHPVHTLHGVSNLPLGVPLPHLHVPLLLPLLSPHFLLAPQPEHPPA
jgi:hypothetical protein